MKKHQKSLIYYIESDILSLEDFNVKVVYIHLSFSQDSKRVSREIELL